MTFWDLNIINTTSRKFETSKSSPSYGKTSAGSGARFWDKL